MITEHIFMGGPVAVLLLGLSVFALALILERLWVYLHYPSLTTKLCQKIIDSACKEPQVFKTVAADHGLRAGISLLLNNCSAGTELREQLCEQWLEGERRYFNHRVKIIGLLGAIAPLLGLLGTVFGIINMFKVIAHTTDPISPALLADGMWVAMVTTALGLLIAIPALAASHGFELWGQRRLQVLQEALNTVNLSMPGVATVVDNPAASDSSALQTVKNTGVSSFNTLQSGAV